MSDRLINKRLWHVAPRSGAWIEISICAKPILTLRVAPRSGAWIEIMGYVSAWKSPIVAPRSGAWIEMSQRISWLATVSQVAPRSGAWIEIGKLGASIILTFCRSPLGGVD